MKVTDIGKYPKGRKITFAFHDSVYEDGVIIALTRQEYYDLIGKRFSSDPRGITVNIGEDK